VSPTDFRAAPSAPISTNHTSMIGPNTAPDPMPVPVTFCKKEQQKRVSSVRDDGKRENWRSGDSRPSMALITENGRRDDAVAIISNRRAKSPIA